jgi:hypothetical protein
MAVSVNGHPTRSRSYTHVIPWVLLSIVTVNLLYPGEVFFQAKYLLILVSILAAFATYYDMTRSEERDYRPKDLAVAFLPLVSFLPAVACSINHTRSQETFLLFFSYSCLFFSLRRGRFRRSFLVASILILCLVTLLIAGHAVYQHTRGLADLRTQVSNSASIEESVKAGILTRIQTGRVFGNFALPNTLAGFLTMMLPLALCILVLSLSPSALLGDIGPLWSIVLQSPWTKLMLVLVLLLSVWVLALTQSFGGWACLFCSLAVAGALWVRQNRLTNTRRMWMYVAVLLVFGTLWVGWIGRQRGFSLWNLEAAENPIVLRWVSFRTALDIFEDFPVTGVGLGNYGTINPRYQSSPQLVTQYAHNTFLQLLSEGGLMLVLGLLLCGYLFILIRRKRDSGCEPRPDLCLRLIWLGSVGCLTAWSIHNCLDIDLYFPSLGALGFFILGLVPGQRGSEERESRPQTGPTTASRWIRAAFMAVLCAGMLLSSRLYLSQMFCDLAVAAAESKDFVEASKLAEWAAAVRNDAPAAVLVGKLRVQRLAQEGRNSHLLLQTLKETFETASRLDPYNASFHFELSRIYAKLGETELSRESREKAISLFPSEPRFRLQGSPVSSSAN